MSIRQRVRADEIRDGDLYVQPATRAQAGWSATVTGVRRTKTVTAGGATVSRVTFRLDGPVTGCRSFAPHSKHYIRREP